MPTWKAYNRPLVLESISNRINKYLQGPNRWARHGTSRSRFRSLQIVQQAQNCFFTALIRMPSRIKSSKRRVWLCMIKWPTLKNAASFSTDYVGISSTVRASLARDGYEWALSFQHANISNVPPPVAVARKNRCGSLSCASSGGPLLLKSWSYKLFGSIF